LLDAEAHVSAKPPEAEQDPRVSYPNEDQIRAGGAGAAARQGAQTGFGETRVSGVAASPIPLSSAVSEPKDSARA
jgi:hypothetical protein